MDLWERIVRWVNSCDAGTTAENIRDTITYTERALRVAEGTASFLNVNRNASSIIRRARSGLSSLAGSLDAAENICLNIQAVRRIYNAVNILNENGVISRNPQRATRAFGDLFLGLGQLASNLPPPANAYAEILSGAGDGFFSNVMAGIDPAQRPRDQRQMREIQQAQGPNVRGM